MAELGERGSANPPGNPSYADELGLVERCIEGDARAVRQFLAQYRSELDRAAHKVRGIGVGDDEFRQVVYVRLFSPGRDGRLRLAAYNGTVSLGHWLRVVAARVAVDMLRARGPELAAPVLAAARPATDTRYRDDVQRAYEIAFAGLERQERALLHALLVRRLSTDRIGAEHGVHRTTAARWIERARTRLHALARAEIRRRFGIRDSTADAIVGDAASVLELSVERLLLTSTATP